VDWREKNTWGCNNGRDPYQDAAVGLFMLSPLDLMFVRLKDQAVGLEDWPVRHHMLLDAWYSLSRKVCSVRAHCVHLLVSRYHSTRYSSFISRYLSKPLPVS
jgi:hypothetical protein